MPAGRIPPASTAAVVAFADLDVTNCLEEFGEAERERRRTLAKVEFAAHPTSDFAAQVRAGNGTSFALTDALS